MISGAEIWPYLTVGFSELTSLMMSWIWQLDDVWGVVLRLSMYDSQIKFMALCNNLAPPFYPSTTLSPSIFLPATSPWPFTSQQTPHSGLLWVCETFKVFLSFILRLPSFGIFLSVFDDKDPLSIHIHIPPLVYPHLPTPSSPQHFCESLIDALQYPAAINLPPSWPQISQLCWFIGVGLPVCLKERPLLVDWT